MNAKVVSTPINVIDTLPILDQIVVRINPMDMIEVKYVFGGLYPALQTQIVLKFIEHQQKSSSSCYVLLLLVLIIVC